MLWRVLTTLVNSLRAITNHNSQIISQIFLDSGASGNILSIKWLGYYLFFILFCHFSNSSNSSFGPEADFKLKVTKPFGSVNFDEIQKHFTLRAISPKVLNRILVFFHSHTHMKIFLQNHSINEFNDLQQVIQDMDILISKEGDAAPAGSVDTAGSTPLQIIGNVSFLFGQETFLEFLTVGGLHGYLEQRIIFGKETLADLGYRLKRDVQDGSVIEQLEYVDEHGIAPYVITLHEFDYDRLVKPYVVKEDLLKQYLDEELSKGNISAFNPELHGENIALCPIFPIITGSKVRFVLDLRIVNKSIRYTNLYFPGLRNLLPKLAKSTSYGSIDIAGAFNRIPIVGDQLGIITTLGVYKLNTLPFGLKSSSTIFNNRLNTVLKTFESENKLVHNGQVHIIHYIDDLVIHGTDDNEVNEVIQNLIDFLNHVGFTINSAKTQLASSRLDYLGVTIENGKIRIPEAKIEAINNFTFPTTKTACRSFIGMVNFFGMFLPNLTDLLAVFHDYVSKKRSSDALFPLMKKNFQRVKNLVKNHVMLSLLDPALELYCYSDASDIGCGCLMWQYFDGKAKVVGLSHHKFSSSELRYSTSEKELLGLVLGIASDPSYRLVHKVNFWVDHQALVRLPSKVDLNPRLLRLASDLQSFDYEIHYRAGELNPSDYISRYSFADSHQVAAITRSKSAAAVGEEDDIDDNIEVAEPVADNNEVEVDAIDDIVDDIGAIAQGDIENPVEPVDIEHHRNMEDEQVDIGKPDEDIAEPVDKEADEQVENSNIENSNVENSNVENSNVENSNLTPESLSLTDIVALNQYAKDTTCFAKLPVPIQTFIKKFVMIESSGVVLLRYKGILVRLEQEQVLLELMNKLHLDFHGSPRLIMEQVVKRKLFHPHLPLFAQSVVYQCSRCESFSKLNTISQELQQMKEVEFGQLLHLDYIELRSADEIFKYVLVISEYSTGFTWTFPTPRLSTLHVVDSLISILSICPLVSQVCMDNASYFRSAKLKEIFKFIQFHFSSSYYPKGNGFVEKRNHLLKKLLKGLCPDFVKWPLFLYKATILLNSLNNIFGYNCIQLMFGHKLGINQLHNILEMDFRILDDLKDDIEGFKQVIQNDDLRLDAMLNRLDNLEMIDQDRKDNIGQKVRARELRRVLENRYANRSYYSVGEIVMLKNSHKRKKNDLNFLGPFVIKARFDKGAYKLMKLDGTVLNGTFNGSQLKICYSFEGLPIRTMSDIVNSLYQDEKKYSLELAERLKEIEKDGIQ